MTYSLCAVLPSQTFQALNAMVEDQRRRDAAKERKRRMDRERIAAKRHRAKVDAEWARVVGTVGGKLIRPIQTPKPADLDLRKVS